MYSFITFLVLCLLEYLFYLWKISKVRDYQEVVMGVSDATGLSRNKHFSRSVIFLSNIVNMTKRWLWPFLLILVAINFIVAVILGTTVHFIVDLF